MGTTDQRDTHHGMNSWRAGCEGTRTSGSEDGPRKRTSRKAAPRLGPINHTHGSLLLKEGVPVKVVSERLGHAHIAHTIQTYQHLLPGMQADAADIAERLAAPSPTPTKQPASDTVERRRNTRRNAA